MTLPKFTEHGEHSKLQPLTEANEPNSTTRVWLRDQVTRDRDPSKIKILDLGCGRGGTVAWLLQHGYDAYGMDVDERYIANGVGLCGPDRLRVLDEGGSYPFPNSYFDAVLSNQVFEHVPNLGELAAEVARVTTPGGQGLHMFPAKWVLREPHMLAPAVHWVPKGRPRELAIRAALRAGRAAPYFAEYELDDRVAIFSEYSQSQTFYRSARTIRSTLEEAGLRTDLRTASRNQVSAKVGRSIPPPLDEVAAWLYRTLRIMYLTTVRA